MFNVVSMATRERIKKDFFTSSSSMSSIKHHLSSDRDICLAPLKEKESETKTAGNEAKQQQKPNRICVVNILALVGR